MTFTERREKMTSVSVSVKLLDILRRHQDNFNLCFATKNTIFSCEVRTSAAALEGTKLGMISSLFVATNKIFFTGSRDICSRLCGDFGTISSVCGQ